MKEAVRAADSLSLLDEGLAALPFTVCAQTVDKLLAYLDLLGKWNKVHNLTAVRRPEEQVRLHLLDCLALNPHLDRNAHHIADIGSGAGLPGIVLALCRPEATVFLVEVNRKKCAFLREVLRLLPVTNARLVATRAERWQPPVTMDIIIARALGAIDPFLSLTAHLGAADTLWVLMKAHDNEPCTTPGFAVSAVEPVHVPLLSAPRVLVKIRHAESRL